MKVRLLFLLFIITGSVRAQSALELSAEGFPTASVQRPALTDEQIMELTRSWPAYFYKGREPYDIYDVTANSMKIDGFRDNAFHYRNLGEVFQHRIKYTMEVVLRERTIDITYAIKEIYADRNPTTLSVADFFAADGRLKDDYRDAKPSLEVTINKLLRSYVGFISR